MENFNILLCEPNGTLTMNASMYFKGDKDINLIACNSVKEFDDVISTTDIHGLIIDLDFQRCEEIAKKITARGIKIILVSRLMEEEIKDLLQSIPHEICFYKPYSLVEIKAAIMKIMMEQPVTIRINPNVRALDERLSSIFIRSGIPPHIKGYTFLREAVKLSVIYPEMINSITKRLYPTIAEMYDTTPSKVERAIRHAIEVAWNRGKIENINAIFGIKIYNKGDKPTNGELIALVADKILIESM